MAPDRAALYVIGAGGHGREIHAYLEDLKLAGWKGTLLGYLDDTLPIGPHGSLAVLGPIRTVAASAHKGDAAPRYLTALGSNAARRAVVARFEETCMGAIKPWTLVHPTGYLGEEIEIGDGSCVAPGVILTSKVKIGRHCILNVKASVSHDCVIGDYANINPGATLCGSVLVGEGAYIGAGAVVKERISIGAWSVIGAGAVVIRDIPPNVTAVGVPARVVKGSGG